MPAKTPTRRRTRPRKSSGDSVFAHVYACILAGGSGTRFWPLSRRARPKQLLRLLGPRSLLEQTAERLRGLVPPERIFVMTSQAVRGEVRRVLADVPAHQVIAEPAGRNTAPSVGLAAHEILRRDPQGIMVVLPSDHLIAKPAAFRRALRTACRWAAVEGRSVLLGLQPTRPESGYGYVRMGARAGRVAGQTVYAVERFEEKPARAAARRYLRSGRYLWNGGMFIWRASTLLRHLERFQPRMARLLERIARAGGVPNSKVFRRLFPRLEKISVDYALIEKIPGVYVLPVDVGWNDVGSWTVVYELGRKNPQGNVAPARSLALDSRRLLIHSPRKFVVAVGVEDLVIVETEDALLVCTRERAQQVGKAVEELVRRGERSLL
jgi:mannose-1-phosphate guanylyltransferase